jgi:hypothetical protein
MLPRSNRAAVVICLLLISGCSLMGQLEKMTPLEKAVWIMSVYNDAAERYAVQAARPDLTEDAKQALRVTKKMLLTAYPLIKAYVDSVDTELNTANWNAWKMALGAVNLLLEQMQ